MGLLARAEKDLDIGGKPKAGPGLFAKASKALVSSHVEEEEEEEEAYGAEPYGEPEPESPSSQAVWPASIPPAPPEDFELEPEAPPPGAVYDLEPLMEEAPPTPPSSRALAFDRSTLEALGADIRALPKSYDADLAVFSRIVEILALDGLALFTLQAGGLALAAVHGQAFSRQASPLSLAEAQALFTEKGLMGIEAVQALGDFVHEDAPPIYAYLTTGSATGGSCLWLAASPAFEASPELGADFSGLLAAAPRPPQEIRSPIVLSPREAAESMKLGSGTAALHRMNFGADYAFLRKAASESLISYSTALVVTAASALVGEEGGAYLLDNGSLAILSYSRRETDIELSRTQFLKSFKRALPFLFSSGLPEGASISLNRSLVSALEIFERLVSE